MEFFKELIHFNILDKLEIIIRIIFATVSGMIIGYTREKINRPAGVRTHSILSLGACIITIVSFTASTGDPGRLAAQIVSGIGFLGAGTIIKNRNKIKGLTTATTLWTTSAIGISFGVGEYFIGIFGTIITFFIVTMKEFTFLQKLDQYMLIIEVKSKESLEDIVEILNKKKVKIQKFHYEQDERTFYIKISHLEKDNISYLKKDILVLPNVENINIED
jgi:putative Mg2+ transporter-C (MgtC) family protein